MRDIASVAETAFDELRSGRVSSILANVVERVGNMYPSLRAPQRYGLFLPYLLLNEVQLLLEEGAIAVPAGKNNWQLVAVPGFERGRKLHTLALEEGTRHGSPTHQQIMADIYTFPGFARIDEGDVVVDVGAYVGGFSRFAARTASEVIAIEPNAVTSDVLGWNTRDLENVTVIPMAAWEESSTLEINRSIYPFENSVLAPDRHDTGQTFQVDADTVPAIVRAQGYDEIDFLKIEAEGVEPEIVRGALDDSVEIRRIAVDTSPERDAQAVTDQVTDILESEGYVCRTKDDSRWWWGDMIVFGTLET